MSALEDSFPSAYPLLCITKTRSKSPPLKGISTHTKGILAFLVCSTFLNKMFSKAFLRTALFPLQVTLATRKLTGHVF